jgi:hypothetical protein
MDQKFRYVRIYTDQKNVYNLSEDDMSLLFHALVQLTVFLRSFLKRIESLTALIHNKSSWHCLNFEKGMRNKEENNFLNSTILE